MAEIRPRCAPLLLIHQFTADWLQSFGAHRPFPGGDVDHDKILGER